MGKLLPERSYLGKQIHDLALRMAGIVEPPKKKKFLGLA
jgi:hypothetical protein